MGSGQNDPGSRKDSIDVLDYDIELDFTDWSSNALDAKATITLDVLAQSLDSIHLDLLELNISSRVVFMAIGAKIVIGKIRGVEALSNNRSHETAVTGVASVDKRLLFGSSGLGSGRWSWIHGATGGSSRSRCHSHSGAAR